MLFIAPMLTCNTCVSNTSILKSPAFDSTRENEDEVTEVRQENVLTQEERIEQIERVERAVDEVQGSSSSLINPQYHSLGFSSWTTKRRS